MVPPRSQHIHTYIMVLSKQLRNSIKLAKTTITKHNAHTQQAIIYSNTTTHKHAKHGGKVLLSFISFY